jgi:hypothetical protein
VRHSSGGPANRSRQARKSLLRRPALPGGKSYKPMSGHPNTRIGATAAMTIGLDFEVRLLDFLNRRAEIEAGVWCGRARVFGDFLADQHGEREVSQAMLTHLRQADITNRA